MEIVRKNEKSLKRDVGMACQKYSNRTVDPIQWKPRNSIFRIFVNPIM